MSCVVMVTISTHEIGLTPLSNPIFPPKHKYLCIYVFTKKSFLVFKLAELLNKLSAYPMATTEETPGAQTLQIGKHV